VKERAGKGKGEEVAGQKVGRFWRGRFGAEEVVVVVPGGGAAGAGAAAVPVLVLPCGHANVSLHSLGTVARWE